jgi:hypothetical protein
MPLCNMKVSFDPMVLYFWKYSDVLYESNNIIINMTLSKILESERCLVYHFKMTYHRIWLITGFLTLLSQRVTLLEQELLWVGTGYQVTQEGPGFYMSFLLLDYLLLLIKYLWCKSYYIWVFGSNIIMIIMVHKLVKIYNHIT